MLGTYNSECAWSWLDGALALHHALCLVYWLLFACMVCFGWFVEFGLSLCIIESRGLKLRLYMFPSVDFSID